MLFGCSSTFEPAILYTIMLSDASSRSLPKAKDGCDSQAEDVGSADAKKTGFKDFIKLLPRRNNTQRSAKDPKSSLDRESTAKCSHIRDQAEVRKYYFLVHYFPRNYVCLFEINCSSTARTMQQLEGHLERAYPPPRLKLMVHPKMIIVLLC